MSEDKVPYVVADQDRIFVTMLALKQAVAAKEIETRREDAKLVCPMCKHGDEIFDLGTAPHHMYGRSEVACAAVEIWRKVVALEKQKEQRNA